MQERNSRESKKVVKRGIVVSKALPSSVDKGLGEGKEDRKSGTSELSGRQRTRMGSKEQKVVEETKEGASKTGSRSSSGTRERQESRSKRNRRDLGEGGVRSSVENSGEARRYSRSANINWKRQREIFNPKEVDPQVVTIVGVGNIGSQTALALARLGVSEMILWDHDKVESHNISSQSFFVNHDKIHKVAAMKDQIQMINMDSFVRIHAEKFDPSKFEGGILVIAVDTMKGREKIHQQLVKHERETGIKPSMILDGRMGGPQLEIYTLPDLETWEKSFVSNPSTDPCGARYICYISMVMGGFMANQIKRIIKGEEFKKNILFNIDALQLLTSR